MKPPALFVSLALSTVVSVCLWAGAQSVLDGSGGLEKDPEAEGKTGIAPQLPSGQPQTPSLLTPMSPTPNVTTPNEMQPSPTTPTTNDQPAVQQGGVQVKDLRAGTAQSRPSYSIDSPTGMAPEGISLKPYNPDPNKPKELNLWQIEQKRFVRSDAVLAPASDKMAYSEVYYMPGTRQTFSKLFITGVPKGAAANAVALSPEEEAELAKQRQALYKAQQPKKWYQLRKKKPQEIAPMPDETFNASRYDPNMQIKTRQELLSVGAETTSPWKFDTLTVVDWSANGRRLLFKRRSGVIYTGLKTTDILVYDTGKGTVTIYPELQRVITHFWDQQQTIPPLDTVTWDMIPLGWEAGSDAAVIIKAWAYDKTHRMFLGVWRYDIEKEETTLVSLRDDVTGIASNGMVSESNIGYDTATGTWYRK